MRTCHIIHLRRIQRLHPNILDDALNHRPGLILFILRRTRARFHTKQQMMVLDPLEFPGIFVREWLQVLPSRHSYTGYLIYVWLILQEIEL